MDADDYNAAWRDAISDTTETGHDTEIIAGVWVTGCKEDEL